MLIDFLKSCTPALQDEKEDYNHILHELSYCTDSFIGFMPSIIDDIWPVYVLECTDAVQFNHHSHDSVYILPFGAHDFFGVHSLEKLIQNWYLHDEIPEKEYYHDAELEESILLNCSDIQSKVSVDVQGNYVNMVYLKISMSNNRKVHILLIIEKSQFVWANVIEKYNIAADIVIDSHKGMGDWFEDVPLYGVIKNTKNRKLLPELYFKGKYISHEAPEGFKKAYEIPEAKSNWCRNEIYYTKW